MKPISSRAGRGCRPVVERLERRTLLAIVTSLGSGNTIGPITPGDFNNDGKTDLLAVVNDGTEVLLSNGDGTFRNAGTLPITAPVVGDFNGDRIPDVASLIWNSDSASGLVRVLLGNGD